MHALNARCVFASWKLTSIIENIDTENKLQYFYIFKIFSEFYIFKIFSNALMCKIY